MIKQNYIALQIGIFIFLAYVFWAFYIPVETDDIWWHLATGRWIFEHQQFPLFDIFSPKNLPSDWILTQSGGSCLLYSIFSIGGFKGLIFFRSLVFCTVIGLILYKAHKKIPYTWLIPFLLIIAVEILLMRIHLRPYIFNFIFILILKNK